MRMSYSLDETSTLLAYCQTEVEKYQYKESDKILTIFTHFKVKYPTAKDDAVLRQYK